MIDTAHPNFDYIDTAACELYQSRDTKLCYVVTEDEYGQWRAYAATDTGRRYITNGSTGYAVARSDSLYGLLEKIREKTKHRRL